jgi:hypothetical protein
MFASAARAMREALNVPLAKYWRRGDVLKLTAVNAQSDPNPSMGHVPAARTRRMGADERDCTHVLMMATDTITLVEGYDAMRIFLEAVCRRHGKTSDEIAFILGGLKWADGTPVDSTMWEDWLAAVQIACGGRMQ